MNLNNWPKTGDLLIFNTEFLVSLESDHFVNRTLIIEKGAVAKVLAVQYDTHSNIIDEVGCILIILIELMGELKTLKFNYELHKSVVTVVNETSKAGNVLFNK